MHSCIAVDGLLQHCGHSPLPSIDRPLQRCAGWLSSFAPAVFMIRAQRMRQALCVVIQSAFATSPHENPGMLASATATVACAFPACFEAGVNPGVTTQA